MQKHRAYHAIPKSSIDEIWVRVDGDEVVLIREQFFYVTEGWDVVPEIDKQGKKMCKGITVYLPPHPEAAFFDHDFRSKTYQPSIRREIINYMEMASTW